MGGKDGGGFDRARDESYDAVLIEHRRARRNRSQCPEDATGIRAKPSLSAFKIYIVRASSSEWDALSLLIVERLHTTETASLQVSLPLRQHVKVPQGLNSGKSIG